MAPFVTIQVRKKYNPWMSYETKELIKNRNFWHKIASESNSKQSWNIFKKLRNKISNRLKYEESQWQKY